MEIAIPEDADGYLGRECPEPECLGYFKITLGTGLPDSTDCYCPYCGHKAAYDQFWTQEQIAYAHSVALNKVTGDLLKVLKKHEFDIRPGGRFGFGMSLKVQGQPHPITNYSEKELETAVVCDCCTLRYAVYGAFGYCPDCGVHNSLQILENTLAIVEKQLAIAASLEEQVASRLVGNALEDVISGFDGFGRELFRVNTHASLLPQRAKKISFQNLDKAAAVVKSYFGCDIRVAMSADEWSTLCRLFEKRHLLAHKMGIVDHEYLAATGDGQSVIGRKLQITPGDVREATRLARRLAAYMSVQFRQIGTGESSTQ